MARTSSKSRIELLISPEALRLVRRAAEIKECSVSDFVAAAAQEAAQRTISEIEVLRLSRKTQEQFIAMLLNPSRPNTALARAFQRHRASIDTK